MSSIPPHSSSSTSSVSSSTATRIELLRAEIAAEADPARKAKFVHAIGRLLDTIDRNDVAAANEYLAAYQANRSQRGALADLIGIYERRKSATNLVKLYQVEAKSAANASDRASALLDLAHVRTDLVGDVAGGRSALAEAFGLAPDEADVALVAELESRRSGATAEIPERIDARLASVDDPLLAAELAVDRAEILAESGDAGRAVAELLERNDDGAAGVRIALALERIARRSDDSDARATGLERLGRLAAGAFENAAGLHEPGIGALLWDDALAARGFAVSAYRVAAALRIARDEPVSRILGLYDAAVSADPSSSIARFERLAWARRLSREDTVAEDEAALANAFAASPIGAFVWHRIAFRKERDGHAEAAVDARARARALAPTSAVLAASDESGLRDRDHASEWRRALDVDSKDATTFRLATAAFVADELENDFATARTLFERAIDSTSDPLPLLRSLYASAVVHGDHQTAGAALARMTGLDPASERRRRFDRAFFAAISLDDPTPAAALASTMLESDQGADVAQVARAIGALADDFRLVERAHVRLAENTTDLESRAAHRCAAARAAIADSRPIDGESHLRAALDTVHGHPVAIAILDTLLRARNDVDGLASLSRLALSGRAGESTDVLELARSAVAAALANDAPKAKKRVSSLLEQSTTATGSRIATIVAAILRDATVAGAARSAADQSETTLGRALAALEAVETELLAGQPLSMDLRPALTYEATEVDAAIVGALLPSSQRADLDPDILDTLERASFADVETFLGNAAGTIGTTEGGWLREAASAPDAASAFESMRASLSKSSGPATKLATDVHRIATTSDDAATDLGLEVLRAAGIEGAGELAAAIADVAFGPADDPQIRATALEAAVRDAPLRERPEFETRLGQVYVDSRRIRDAFRTLDASTTKRPDDVAGLEQLRMVSRDAVEHSRFVDVSDALASRLSGDARAELLEDASTVLAESLGRLDDARTRVLAAIDAAPTRERAHARARVVLSSMRDDAGLAEIAAKRASASGDTVTRLRQLFEVARHRRTANDRPGTLAAIDELLTIDPKHAGALAMKAEIHVAQEEFGEAVDALRRLAEADVPAAQKRVARLGAADFLERKLARSDAALVELRAIDALGLADAAILQRIARLLDLEDRYDDALALHERVLAMPTSAGRLGESERERARLLLRLKRDPAAAALGLGRALAHVPDDVDAAGLLVRIASSDEERVAIVRSVDTAVRRRLTPETLSPEILRKLLAIGEMRGARDLTKLVLSTLTTLRVATEEERSREEENTAIVRRVRPPTHPIVEALEAMRAEGDRGACAQIAAELFDVFVDLIDVDVAKLGGHKNDVLPKSDNARAELADLASAFGITDVEVHPSSQLDARKLIGLSTERGVSFVVPRGLAVPIDPVLRFHAGRAAWAVKNKTLPLVQRSLDEARTMLIGALDACEVPVGELRSLPNVPDWSKAIGKALGRRSKKTIHDLGLSFEDRGAVITAFCRAARQSSLRAGLLVSSDLEAALAIVLGTAPSFRSVLASNEASDLVCFHLSSTSLMLRRELGLAS